MGKRFLAVLAVVALGAGSAMVGMTMASGSWEVVGTGLAPGEGYAVKLADGADRLRFALAEPGENPMATFAVFDPDGERVGYYALDASNGAAEIVGGVGTWMVFVYKAHGADLTVAVHGTEGAGKFLPADIRREDLKLAHEQSERAAFEKTYTMVLDEAPVLAGVYLKGSARNLQTELWTEKGVVEVVSEEELAAAGSVIVDSKGARNTFPQNLQEGPFTAKVKADELSGTLQLVALYLETPDFGILEEVEVEEEAEAEEAPEAKPKRHAHARHPPKAPAPPAMEAAECGEAESRVPYALEVPHGAMLRLTLERTVDPPVTVFDPMDNVLAVVVLEEEGDEALVPLGEPGEYVLYARGATVKVEVLGVAECELRALDMEGVLVAEVSGEGLLGPTSATAGFLAEKPPLEFGIHLGGERDATSAAMNLRAVFHGPDGEAGAAYQTISLGLTGGSGLFPWWGNEHPDGIAEVDAAKMLQGEWMVEVEADTLNGDLVIYALHYLREAAEHDKDA